MDRENTTSPSAREPFLIIPLSRKAEPRFLTGGKAINVSIPAGSSPAGVASRQRRHVHQWRRCRDVKRLFHRHVVTKTLRETVIRTRSSSTRLPSGTYKESLSGTRTGKRTPPDGETERALGIENIAFWLARQPREQDGGNFRH